MEKKRFRGRVTLLCKKKPLFQGNKFDVFRKVHYHADDVQGKKLVGETENLPLHALGLVVDKSCRSLEKGEVANTFASGRQACRRMNGCKVPVNSSVGAVLFLACFCEPFAIL